MDTNSIDQSIATLQSKKTEWARMAIADKRRLLAKARERTRIVADRWVAAAARAKGLSPTTQPMAEEWLSGPWAFVVLVNTAWLSGDWHPAPKLPGFITHQRGSLVGERMTYQAIDRSLLGLIGFGAALYRP